MFKNRNCTNGKVKSELDLRDGQSVIDFVPQSGIKTTFGLIFFSLNSCVLVPSLGGSVYLQCIARVNRRG